jgi:hypothetical protein
MKDQRALRSGFGILVSAAAVIVLTAAPVPQLLGQTTQPPRLPKATGHGSVMITSAEVDGLVKGFFSDAQFTANSCGNVNATPHQMKFGKAGVAPLVQPLGRLEYNLTESEKRKTIGNYWSGIPLIASQSGQLRTKTVRACTEYWTPELWIGEVKAGKLRVQIKLHTLQKSATVPGSFPKTTPLVKTRRIVEHNVSQSDAPIVGGVLAVAGWRDAWDWKHPYADATIKDYHNGQSWLTVELSPGVANGAVTYDVVGTAWQMTGGGFMNSHSIGDIGDTDFLLFNQLPGLQGRILAFNESSKKTISSFAASVFKKADVKSLLSQALLNLAKQKVPSGSIITNVKGEGSGIRVSY